MATKKKAQPKKTPTTKSSSEKLRTKDLCFTIMPFGGWFDDYYETVFCPAIESAGLEPCRADDLYRPSTIVNDIWSYTKRSELVLADLSGKNPNVFYELGLAHALAKPAILVVESMDDVPFDLRALRVIEYDKNSPKWGDLLKEKIEKAIIEVLASPTQAVLPAFLDVKEIEERPTVTEQEKELISLRQDIEMMRSEFRRSQVRAIEPSTRPIRQTLSIGEAQKLTATLINKGLPDNLVADLVSYRGAPAEWVKDEIKRQSLVLKATPKKKRP